MGKNKKRISDNAFESAKEAAAGTAILGFAVARAAASYTISAAMNKKPNTAVMSVGFRQSWKSAKEHFDSSSRLWKSGMHNYIDHDDV